MNYELAKELKDAGFLMKEYRPAADIFEGGFVAPTLSELIESCGKEFSHLVYDIVWRAFAKDDIRNGEVRGHYKTPEEAVARLWLVLNKKDL